MKPPADLEQIERDFLRQCGPCDFGLVEYGCTCPTRDERPVIADLVDEIRFLRLALAAPCLGCRRSP